MTVEEYAKTANLPGFVLCNNKYFCLNSNYLISVFKNEIPLEGGIPSLDVTVDELSSEFFFDQNLEWETCVTYADVTKTIQRFCKKYFAKK